ncbi:hypothetical protein SB860_39335, partial [Burkholderia sp. SIMBA_019]
VIEGEGVRAQVVAGSLFGKTSLVKTHSPLFYGDLQLQAGAVTVLPAGVIAALLRPRLRKSPAVPAKV